MYALVVAGLLNVDEDKFSNTTESGHFLVKGNPAYMGGIHARMALTWESTLDTAESIRTGIPQARLDFSGGSEEKLERFLRAIQPQTITSGQELADKWDFSSCRKLADVGGGSGGLAIALTEKCPHVKATVVDLPTVTPITQRIVDEAGASDRVGVTAADVLGGRLAGSYDVAVLRALIQVLSPEDAVKALKNVREAIRPGGTIHIIGRMLDNSRLTPASSVSFSLLTINLYDDGQSYTEQEYADWLAEAGFEGFERARLTEIDDIVTARNPG
ncbi:MAG: methyltransferase [Chloroflexi bacterium]|nr:methyltransferase [Chloroflexota bacterium]MDA1226588.1 methyltransferase [Chloroflexota bacterium]